MKVGQVLKSKGGKTYLKFEKATTIQEGEALFISTPAEDIQFLVETGKLTAAEGEAKLAKVPSFVLYNIKQVSNTGANVNVG